jgi:hypothetical protein
VHGVDGEVGVFREEHVEFVGINAVAFIVWAETWRGDSERGRGGGAGYGEGGSWCGCLRGCDRGGSFGDVAGDDGFGDTRLFIFVRVYGRRDYSGRLRNE